MSAKMSHETCNKRQPLRVNLCSSNFKMGIFAEYILVSLLLGFHSERVGIESEFEEKDNREEPVRRVRSKDEIQVVGSEGTVDLIDKDDSKGVEERGADAKNRDSNPVFAGNERVGSDEVEWGIHEGGCYAHNLDPHGVSAEKRVCKLAPPDDALERSNHRFIVIR